MLFLIMVLSALKKSSDFSVCELLSYSDLNFYVDDD